MRVRVAFGATVVFAVLGAASLPAQMIDRVLAVVGGSVITQTDVQAALLFGLVSAPPQGADSVRTTLDQLIPREIILAEVNRSGPADVDRAAVDGKMAAIRARFSSEADYRAALERTAMTGARLQGIVVENQRIEEYVQQRFGAVVQPSDGEVADYYAAHREELAAGGRATTLEQARPIIEQRLTEQRRAAVIDEWVTRLRRRVDVTDVYFAQPARTGK